MSADELHRRLDTLVDRLVEAVRGEPDSAIDCGTTLVELHATGPAVLRSSMDLLGAGLLALPELTRLGGLAEKVVSVISAFASGYVERTLVSIASQQETMTQAVFKAFTNVQRDVAPITAQFDHLVASTASGVALTNPDGRFAWANKRLGEILGYSESELTQITLVDALEPDNEPGDGHTSQAPGRHQHQRRVRRGDGDSAWVSFTLSRPHPDQQRQLLVVDDHSELHLVQRQLNHQLLYDALTGLPNRQFLTTQLERALRHADRDTGVTVYHLDLDGFSLTTQGLGRSAGDTLLGNVAWRLQAVVAAEKAMVARVGADEFVILVENSPGTPDPVSMIRRIEHELAKPVHVDGHGVAALASIGVVDRPPANMGAPEVLDAAALALARAKRNGRAQWSAFDPFADARNRSRFVLAASLPGAWQRDQLDSRLQPIVRLRDKQVIGVDATLSWDHPQFGRLSHGQVGELAEQSGLIMPLGDWLLRAACGSRQPQPLHVALTPNQSSDMDLVGRVLEILRETDVRPDRLWLGIPASALDRDEAAENVRLLADAGVQTEITGFGATSADLAHLERLPARAVRIARWLVQRQTERPDHQGLFQPVLRELVAIAHEFGATVTVDGIDTADQADWWQRVGADCAGGELVAPAGSLEDIATPPG